MFPSRQDGDGSDESPTSPSRSSARSSPPPSALSGHTRGCGVRHRVRPHRAGTEQVRTLKSSSVSRTLHLPNPISGSTSCRNLRDGHGLQVASGPDAGGQRSASNQSRAHAPFWTNDEARLLARSAYIGCLGDSCERARSATASATTAPFESWNVRLVFVQPEVCTAVII